MNTTEKAIRKASPHKSNKGKPLKQEDPSIEAEITPPRQEEFPQHEAPEPLLKRMDIYGQKIEMSYLGKSYFPTRAGGVLTIASVVFLFLGVIFKLAIDSSLREAYQEPVTSDRSGRRRLDGHMGSEDHTMDMSEMYSSFDYYDESNFKFYERTETPFNVKKYNESINVFYNGIKKIRLVLNHGEKREDIEKEMYLRMENDARSFEATVRKNEIKTFLATYGKYFIFKLSSYYLPGTENEDALQVENLINFKHVHYYKYTDIKLSDDTDKFSIFPYLDITDYVNIMGDFYSYNETKMKAFTKLEMKIDYFELEKTALVNAETEVASYTDERTCTIADVTTTSAEFSLKSKDELLADFVQGVTNYDAEFYAKYKAYEAEIDDMIKASNLNNYLNTLHSDSDTWYDHLDTRVKKCFTDTSGNDATMYSIYKQKRVDLITAIKEGLVNDAGLFEGSFFDSVLLQVQEDNEKEPTTVAQSVLQWECIEQASDTSYVPGVSSKNRCTRTDHVLDFQLNENYVQDIMMYPNKENKVKGLKANGQILKPKDYQISQSVRYVGAPTLGTSFIDEDFDVLYSVLFTLNPSVQKNKEIWMVQDPETARTTTLLNLIQREESIVPSHGALKGSILSSVTAKFDTNLIDLVVYVGGLWFFIAYMVAAPLRRRLFQDSKDLEEAGIQILVNRKNALAMEEENKILLARIKELETLPTSPSLPKTRGSSQIDAQSEDRPMSQKEEQQPTTVPQIFQLSATAPPTPLKGLQQELELDRAESSDPQ